MPKVKDMLDTYPRTFNVDADLLAETVEALLECANTCSQCADACLSESNVTELAKCIRLNLDCADLCRVTSRSLSRQTEYDANLARPLLEACATACKSCGDECVTHSDHMGHCRICAESCRRCEQACRQLLGAISS